MLKVQCKACYGQLERVKRRKKKEKTAKLENHLYCLRCDEIIHFCPLCMYIDTEINVQKRVEKEHTDEEMIELTGWDLCDFD